MLINIIGRLREFTKKRDITLFKLIVVFLGIISILFLLLPIFLVIPTAFTESWNITFPPKGFTLKWFIKFFESSGWMTAFKNSIIVAIPASIFSLFITFPAALAFREDFRAKGAMNLLILTPFFTPPLLMGISLLMLFSQIGLRGTYLSIIIGHIVWIIPVSFLVLTASLEAVDKSVEEAARVLGASWIRTTVEVTIPLIRVAIISAILFGFIISLNEFMIAYFVSVPSTGTLPLQVWSGLRTSLSPLVSVSSTIIVSLTLGILVLLSRMINFKTFY